jgi:hypothetical protein
MAQIELLRLFTAPLEQANLTYMVTGSVASIMYGLPRFTHDVDLVLDVSVGDIVTFVALFPLVDYYCPPEEILLAEIRRRQRGHFNLIHHQTGYKADVYLFRQDELHRWGLDNRRRVDLNPQVAFWVAPPEYVIIRKLEYYQEGGSVKHIQDIRGMLEISGDSIDQKVILTWVKRKGLSEVWGLCQ